ncbi:hypothetical protein VIMS_04159 [Mycobacterium marinum]|nr:hypothetical protein VIMS_04159 [Mycobacterium marinum]
MSAMVDRVVLYVVTCVCEGALQTREGIRTGKLTVGWIDDKRAENNTVSLLAYHVSVNWRDRSENAIRCERCRSSAQFSEATAFVVCDLLAQHLDKFATVERTSPHDSSLIEIRHEVPLGVLCRMLAPNNR